MEGGTNLTVVDGTARVQGSFRPHAERKYFHAAHSSASIDGRDSNNRRLGDAAIKSMDTAGTAERPTVYIERARAVEVNGDALPVLNQTPTTEAGIDQEQLTRLLDQASAIINNEHDAASSPLYAQWSQRLDVLREATSRLRQLSPAEQARLGTYFVRKLQTFVDTSQQWKATAL